MYENIAVAVGFQSAVRGDFYACQSDKILFFSESVRIYAEADSAVRKRKWERG